MEEQVEQLHQTHLHHGQKLGGFLHQVPRTERKNPINKNLIMMLALHYIVNYTNANNKHLKS